MTRSLRTFVVVFLAVLSFDASLALAQGPAPGKANVAPRAANGKAPVQPAGGVKVAPQPPPVAKADPRLEKLLREWEVSSAKIKSLHGKHIRSRSNSVFATDARAAGQFYFDAPDKGRIDLKGQSPEKGAVSSKKTPAGEPYSLTADRDEKWICDGKQVLMIDEAQKQYEGMPLPPEMQGANIIESPLPFLFGMKAADAKKRFQMELIHLDEQRKLARITAIPLQNKDAQNFMRAEIVLDTEEYLPKFVSLVDPAGTITTQYIFQEVNVNNAGALAKVQGIFGNDPFKPNLRGYKLVQPQGVQQVNDVQPIGGNGKVNRADGKMPAPAFPPQQPNRQGNVVIPRGNPQTSSSINGQRTSK